MPPPALKAEEVSVRAIAESAPSTSKTVAPSSTAKTSNSEAERDRVVAMSLHSLLPLHTRMGAKGKRES